MMKTLIIVAMAIALSATGCKEDNPVNPGSEGTLFISSFESNNNTSYDGWIIPHGDTINIRFENDVPSNGGLYSISLQSVNTLPVQITKTIPVSAGTNVYTLNLFSKYFGAGGSFSFGIKDQQGRKITEVTDSTWNEYKVSDTLTAVQGDSIIVILSGGTSQLVPGKTYYDVVSLKRE